MNSGQQNTDKQRLLDLLVDGELSESERGDLLAWCEREPEGWRRCALAFLEAQNWSSVLGALTDTSRETATAQQVASAAEVANRKTADRKTVARPMPLGPSPFWNVRQWGTMLAMAASVVLAFTLGLWIRDAGRAGQIAPQGLPAVNVVRNGPEAGSRETPVAEPGDSDWLPMQAAAVPEDVRQALERLGHHVEQQRRLVPYRLDDGRRVVIPVDQVQVRPAEIGSYQ